MVTLTSPRVTLDDYDNPWDLRRVMSTLPVYAPYDRSLLGELPFMSPAQIEEAFIGADRLAQSRSSWLPPYKRLDMLQRFLERLTLEAESLAQLATREGGKPITDSRIELARALDGVRIAIRELQMMSGREIPMRITPSSAGRIAFTSREPRGTVLAISAFNHPVNLIIHQVIPALAVGAPVIIKPSLKTPLSCVRVIKLLHEAGVPENWCQMILCEDALTEKVASDRRIAFLSFIGSSRVGWRLRSQLAPGTTCALEHGGVAPTLIDKTADLAVAIPLIVKGAFYHAGQVCVSTQRVYVDEAIFDDACDRLVSACTPLRVGDPGLDATEVGPLIHPNEVARVSDWVREASATGRVACGGAALSDTCYTPTVVIDPSDASNLSTQEVFGPVVAIYRVKNRDEAIRRANATNSFFQASIFTKEIDAALDASRNLNATAVMVNDHTAFRVDWMPFGGHRESGLGVGGIGPAMHDMTIERMIVIRSASL